MTTRNKLRFVAALHVFTAAQIVFFWIGFYTEMIFPKELLAPLISNYEGYYAWETSFTMPDLIMAAVMAVGGVKLWRDTANAWACTCLIAASGAAIFLGVLDFMYDAFNGMYFLGHLFSVELALIGVYMPIFGVLSIITLHRNRSEARAPRTFQR